MSEELTNGQQRAKDYTPAADAARMIASCCEGRARVSVYTTARDALAAQAARIETLERALREIADTKWNSMTQGCDLAARAQKLSREALDASEK